jgi:transglutaminase-like putative cysteine protease
MDFSGWFEANLNGRWFAFDARHGTPLGLVNVKPRWRLLG